MLERARAELDAVGHGGGWVVIGSAAMAIAGLDVEPGDVDVFMRPWVYERALIRPGWAERYPTLGDPPMLVYGDAELPVCGWWRWRHRSRWSGPEPTVEEIIAGTRWVDGWPIMDLSLLAEWKCQIMKDCEGHPEYRARVEKDRRHVEMLEAAGYGRKVA